MINYVVTLYVVIGTVKFMSTAASSEPNFNPGNSNTHW